MARPRTIPTYREKDGQAVVTLNCRVTGRRKQFTLGKWGSAASKAEYARIIAEWNAADERLPGSASDVTIVEICAAFQRHADQHYRDAGGQPTGEAVNYRQAIEPLLQLYSETPAKDFGPLALETVRRKMIELGWQRKSINQKINRLRHIFKWAASQELIDAGIWQRLRTLAALAPGRSDAAESAAVAPVDPKHVDAVLPFLSAPVRGIVELMRFTGCRPGEACSITRRQIDTSGQVWIYRPTQHKTKWRGKERLVAIGPRAQLVIRPFFKPDLDAPLFQPRDAKLEEWTRAALRRKTKRYPYQRKNRERFLRNLRPTYSPMSVDKCVYRACDRARIPRWSANQLRHLFATQIRKARGLEAVGALLGHSQLETSQIYAEKNMELAIAIAGEVG